MRLGRYFSTAGRLAIAVLLGLGAGATAYAQELGGVDDAEDLDMNNPRVVARQLGVSGDDMRPDEQFETTLFGRTLIIGGELEAAGQARRRLDPGAEDGVAKLTPEAQLEFLYLPTDQIVAFAEVKAFTDDEIWSEADKRESEAGLDLREAWVLLPNLFGSHVSLQAGKQQYQDRREWWWNENLDSVRLHYLDGPVTGFLGFAETVLRTSTLEDIDPEEKKVQRILGNAAYSWSKHDRLEAFLLDQRDKSGVTPIGARVGEDDADESDADLTWFGIRARTRQKLGDLGKAYINLDLAGVQGEETLVEYDDLSPGLVQVADTSRRDVSGWATELTFSWELPLDSEPVLSAAYAYGSGDSDPGDGEDGNFRQTGLHGDNSKFRGISRFRYYGETIRPELSNVGIATLSAGTPAPGPTGGEAWLEVIYHNYRQAELSDTFKTDRLDVDPNGLSKDLGNAFDVVYAFELGRNWEFEATVGGFRYGDAFGAAEGKWATSLSFKLDYNF